MPTDAGDDRRGREVWRQIIAGRVDRDGVGLLGKAAAAVGDLKQNGIGRAVAPAAAPAAAPGRRKPAAGRAELPARQALALQAAAAAAAGAVQVTRPVAELIVIPLGPSSSE